MLKLIHEDSDNFNSTNISKVYEIEVPIRIEGLDIEIPEELIDKNDLNNLFKKYELYINDNIDIDNDDYQVLVNNDIEIIDGVTISKELLKIQCVSIPIDLTESEVKSIVSNYLTSSYLSPYEDLVIEVTPEQYNELYSEEISNGEISPRSIENKEAEKLSVNVELVLELDKLKIIKL